MDRAMSQGWALQLSRLLYDLGQEELPRSAVAAAKNRLLHAVGVCLANNALPAAQVAWKAFGHSKGESLVYGRSQRLAAEDAAFVNGVIGHGSLLEDCGPGGLREGSHPGTFVIPAALAVAEDLDASGADLISALVVGYEAVSRIGLAGPVQIVQRKFRPLGVMGAFGSAAAVARLMGATPDEMRAALAIAANLAGGSTQGIFEGSMEPYFQAAFAARNGILAARLAMAGAVVADEALEGEFGFFQTFGGEPGVLERLIGPRDRLGIEIVGTKRFAACLQNQETLALIVDGLAKPLQAEQIERVVVARPATGTNGLNSPGVSREGGSPNMLSAQMSARFSAAAALLGKPVDNPAFFAENYANPEIENLTRRIALEPTTGGLVSVRITLRGEPEFVVDGDMSQVLFPSDDQLQQRFRHRVSPILGQGTESAARGISSLETFPSVRSLTAAFGSTE
jgi:2-methylcitrate dehydratase PrpD